MLKKYCITIAIFLLIPTFAHALWAKTFLDEHQFPEWSKTAINNMTKLGLIKGYNDNYFKPNNYVTRAELAKILDRTEQLKILQFEKYSFMKSALENVDTKNEIKTAIALAAAEFKRLDKKPTEGMKVGSCTDTKYMNANINT